MRYLLHLFSVFTLLSLSVSYRPIFFASVSSRNFFIYSAQNDMKDPVRLVQSSDNQSLLTDRTDKLHAEQKKEEEKRVSTFWRGVVLFVCVIWSTNFAVIKAIYGAVPSMDPSLYAAIRFDLAALALLPRTLGCWDNKQLILTGLAVGACKFTGYFGQAVGLVTFTADKSAFLCSMNVVWVALITFFATKEIRLQTWLSVVLAVAGVAFLELKGSAAPVAGDLWLFLQPIGFGSGYFIIERFMQESSEPVSSDEIIKQKPNAGALSAFAVGSVGIASTVWAAMNGHTLTDLKPVLASPIAIGGLLYTALFTTAGMIWLQSRSLKNVSASDASIILSSEPVWAAIFSAVVLGETLNKQDIIGGGMIVAACLFNEIDLIGKLFPQTTKI